MIAVHLDKGRVEVRKFPQPSRPERFALIRLITAGICNTDLELQRGYYGFSGVPGHEFVGEVVEADTPGLRGKRVVGEINLACGGCEFCRRGLGRHCSERTVLGIVRHPGAFSEFFTLPEQNLHVVPDDLPSERAVFTEPLAAACEIMEQVEIPQGGEVAVLGDGKLGLLCAGALLAHGARVHVYGHHMKKLWIVHESGAETFTTESPAANYDWVIEATGSPEGLHEACRMVRPRGTVIMKSTIHATVALDTAPLIVNEITLVGSRCGRFEPALDLLSRGAVRVDDMISDCFPLSQAARAFDRAGEKGVLKVLLHLT